MLVADLNEKNGAETLAIAKAQGLAATGTAQVFLMPIAYYTGNAARAEKFFAGSGHTFAELLELSNAGKVLPRFPIPASARAEQAGSRRPDVLSLTTHSMQEVKWS